jgi:hypothetical protein
MLDGSATAFHSISSGAATQNRRVPSSTIAATATPRSTSSSVNSSSPIPAASHPSNLSKAAYVGIAITIAVGITLLWAATYLLRKRRRSRKQAHVLMPIMVPPRDSPMSSHSIKQGDVYGNSTVAATPNQLAAEKRVSELRAETLFKLEGDREHTWFACQDLCNAKMPGAGQCERGDILSHYFRRSFCSPRASSILYLWLLIQLRLI